MRVAFRVDASDAVGMGHFVRCLALADQIASAGGRISFVTGRAHPAMISALAVRDFDLRELDLAQDASAAADAASSAQALDAETDWLVVDHYGLDHCWELAVRGRASHLLVIDDLANRRHHCDVLVDPGHGREASAYSGLVPDHAQLLLGTRFALLQPAFRALHDAAPGWPAKRRVHVFFGGGATAAQWLAPYCEWLLESFADLELRAVGSPGSEAMQALVRRFPGRLGWRGQVEDMATHMVACDAAFGGPGSATWERACIGLPMALVATAENQVPLLEQFGKAGFAAYLGRASELDARRFVAGFAAFIADHQALAGQRARGVAGVDGYGTERVARHLQTRGVELA